MLYTDGSIDATDEEVAAEHQARTLVIEAETNRALIQGYIDGTETEGGAVPVTPNLAAQQVNGLGVDADEIDGSWVVISFPADASTPKFWAGVMGQILAGKAKTTADPLKLRIPAGKAIEYLKQVDALLA